MKKYDSTILSKTSALVTNTLPPQQTPKGSDMRVSISRGMSIHN
jgi:hypothetical protein